MENDYQKEIEELKARIEIEELKAKLSALERGETPKSKGSIKFPTFDKDKIKGFFVSNKKLIIIISIITIFAVAILTTSICLIGIRGVYVNVDDPFESYVFTASAYEYRNDLDTEEPYLEKGTWKKKGNVISFTVKDELFGKLSSDYYLDVAKGNKSITIKEDNESEGDTFERVSVLGWSSVQNKKVEIKFDLNGGTSDTPIENQELKFLDKIDYKVADPVRQDATFMGWYDKVDGFKDKENSNRYFGGFTSQGVYKDVTYYANWFFHSDCPGHEYDSTCTCITCGKVEHEQDLNNDHKCDRCSEILTQCLDVNENCLCDVCNVIVHKIENCVCANCSQAFHEPNSRCVCENCNQIIHDLNANCVCQNCSQVCHELNANCECKNCNQTFHEPTSNCGVCIKCNFIVHKNIVGGVCEDCGGTAYTRESNYIYFGAYPQSKVTDKTLKSKLKSSAGAFPTSSNSGNWTSYGYYISGSVSNYMWYIDKEYEGEKYRGVYFTSYRPNWTTDSSSSYNNSNQYDNGYLKGNLYWFKYEPIKWRILSEGSGKALILAELILDAQEFYPSTSSHTENGTTIYANNWEYSTIRKWLNETFYNVAFNDLQKALIVATELDNKTTAYDGSSNSNATCQNNTTDKVFLLSYKDILNTSYGFLSSGTNNTAMRKQTSDYAQVQGASTSKESNYLGNGYWWLRSPNDGYYSYYASYVNFYGNVGYRNYVHSTDNGVVPALTIML